MDLLAEIDPQSIAVRAHAETWREAVTLAGDLLVAGGLTNPAYTDEMVAAVERLGPYMVIAPGIALAHGRPSPAVRKTGFSVATLARPVTFGSERNDPVGLVVGLAAVGDTSHLELVSALAKFLGHGENVEALLAATTAVQVVDILGDWN